MILAYNKIMPPREWMHKYSIKNKHNKSLKDYLIESCMPVP